MNSMSAMFVDIIHSGFMSHNRCSGGVLSKCITMWAYSHSLAISIKDCGPFLMGAGNNCRPIKTRGLDTLTTTSEVVQLL